MPFALLSSASVLLGSFASKSSASKALKKAPAGSTVEEVTDEVLSDLQRTAEELTGTLSQTETAPAVEAPKAPARRRAGGKKAETEPAPAPAPKAKETRGVHPFSASEKDATVCAVCALPAEDHPKAPAPKVEEPAPAPAPASTVEAPKGEAKGRGKPSALAGKRIERTEEKEYLKPYRLQADSLRAKAFKAIPEGGATVEELAKAGVRLNEIAYLLRHRYARAV
jgi:hypothetical protein